MSGEISSVLSVSMHIDVQVSQRETREKGVHTRQEIIADVGMQQPVLLPGGTTGLFSLSLLH